MMKFSRIMALLTISIIAAGCAQEVDEPIPEPQPLVRLYLVASRVSQGFHRVPSLPTPIYRHSVLQVLAPKALACGANL